MIRALKVGSVTGARWAGEFRKLASRFVQPWLRKPGVTRSRVDVFEGYLAKHSLVGGCLTTRVIDPPGFLLGFVDSAAEGSFQPDQRTVQTYLWPAYDRDVFAPGVPIPDELESKPADPSAVELRDISGAYRIAQLAIGQEQPFLGWWFTRGLASDDLGIGTAHVSSQYTPASTGESHATIRDDMQLRLRLRFFAADRGRTLPNAVALEVSEGGLDVLMAGYRLAPRMYPVDTDDGSERPLSVRMPRQLPLPHAARDLGRSAFVTSVVTSPVRTDFEYASGRSALLIGFVSTSENAAEFAHRAIEGAGALPQGVEIEAWDDTQPWLQAFDQEEEVSWFDPAAGENRVEIVNVSHVVSYPPGGTYLYAGRVSQEETDPEQEAIPVRDFMPNSMGVPALVFTDEHVRVVFDYRMTRTWVDERESVELHPLLRPVTLQTQTGLVAIDVAYRITEQDDGTMSVMVGAPEYTHLRRDVSGALANCFEGLGGDREDFHRLYRVRWAGNVGGRRVVLVSIVKHLRWEDEAENVMAEGAPILPALPGAVILKTAQSGINAGHPVDWRYTYERSDGASVFGHHHWELPETTRIPGDAGDTGAWLDALGVAVIIDDAVTEFDAVALGWSLVRSPTRRRLREDDWRWAAQTEKCGAVISDSELVITAYALPNEEGDAPVVKLLALNVTTLEFRELRQDPLPSSGARPAVTCYQRRVVREDLPDIEPCLIYRLGEQNAPGGWMELSKDGGGSWHRIWDGAASPGHGAAYIGSQLWTPDYGDTFKNYR